MLITFRKIPRGSKIYFQEPVFQTDVRGTCFLPASPYVMMDLWRLFKEQYKMVIRGHTLLPSLVNYGGTETPPGEETGLAASAALPGGPATSGDQGASAATHLISRSRGQQKRWVQDRCLAVVPKAPPASQPPTLRLSSNTQHEGSSRADPAQLATPPFPEIQLSHPSRRRLCPRSGRPLTPGTADHPPHPWSTDAAPPAPAPARARNLTPATWTGCPHCCASHQHRTPHTVGVQTTCAGKERFLQATKCRWAAGTRRNHCASLIASWCQGQ